MSIEDIHIVNKELCKALAQAAVKATELEMTRIDNDVQVTRAATDMNSLQIRTKGEALAKEITANAESSRISIVSKAEADRIRQIDKVMNQASDVTKNREMVLATAKSLGSSKTTLIFSDSQTGNDILNGNMAHIMR
jgi:regulator of protease activity HflC (stomatin/prohibitin superfamily)